MKVLATVSAVTLLLIFGMAVPTLAQDDHRDESAKPAQHEAQAKPAKQQRQAKPAKQSTQNRAAQHTQQAKPVKQQQAKPAQRQQQAKTTRPANRQQAANRQHQRSAADQQRQRSQPALRLSARGNSRIPDNDYRSHFGRGHEFRIGTPRLVGGYSRFQYGGYWFGFVDPWPANWYYTDEVYVVYANGGYYLCNPSYPGTQVAISVVL